MHNHAEQFTLIGSAHQLRVGAHRVERYHHIAAEQLAPAVVKRNDVGIIVVLKKLPVHSKNLLIIAKQITELAEHPAMLLPYPIEPALEKIEVKLRHSSIAVGKPLNFFCH